MYKYRYKHNVAKVVMVVVGQEYGSCQPRPARRSVEKVKAYRVKTHKSSPCSKFSRQVKSNSCYRKRYQSESPYSKGLYVCVYVRVDCPAAKLKISINE